MTAIPRRIGFYSLRRTAHELCKYIVLFTPIIRRTYPNATVLLAALEAANIACAALSAAIDQVAEQGV